MDIASFSREVSYCKLDQAGRMQIAPGSWTALGIGPDIHTHCSRVPYYNVKNDVISDRGGGGKEDTGKYLVI